MPSAPAVGERLRRGARGARPSGARRRTAPASCTCSAIALDHQRAHRDRRDEVAVHHVDVDHRRAGVEHLLDLRAEAREVGRQDRRRDARPGAQIGTSIDSRQWLHAYSAVLDIRTIVECSPQFGHTERQLEAVQAVHAAVAAGQVRRAAATARRSPGRRRRGRSSSSGSRASARRRRATKNPSVPSRCGSVCRYIGRVRMLPHRPARTRRSSAAKSGRSARKRSHDALVLGRGDRAGRVDERAAGRSASAPGAQDRALQLGERAPGSPALLAPARVGARRRACRGPSTAGRRARGRRPRGSCGSAASAVRTSTLPAPMRAAVRASASARPAWRSTATTAPRSSISAARWVVLPPGAAHRSSTRSPGCGAEDPRRPPSRRATAA